MKKLVIAGALAAAIAIPGVAQAAKGDNNGKHLGDLARECSAVFVGEGATVGQGNQLVVSLFGNNGGGVPANLVEFCGYTP